MQSLVLIGLMAFPVDTGRRSKIGPVVVLYLTETLETTKGWTRLVEMGFDVRRVKPEDLSTSLKTGDVLFLPSSWAEAGLRDGVRNHREAIERFLRQGGGVYVSQPNVDGEIDELPLRFTVANWYDSQDWTERVGKPRMLEGLKPTEMPFPADRIVEQDPGFEVLARGKNSGSASLMIASWRGGRILVNTDNENLRDPSESAAKTCNTSDACLKRLLEWLARRTLRPVRK